MPQGTSPRILGGILKGLKGGKVENDADSSSSMDRSLKGFFSKDPFLGPLATAGDKEIELSIGNLSRIQPPAFYSFFSLSLLR